MDEIERMYQTAMESLAEDEMDEARACLRFLMDAAPDDPRTLEIQGDFARMRGEFTKAEKLYTRIAVVSDDPHSHGISCFSRALLACDQSDLKRAQALFLEARERFIESGSTSPLIHSLGNLGNTCAELGHLQQAVDAFQEALQAIATSDDPDEFAVEAAELHERTGTMFRMLGELAHAEQHLNEAMVRYRQLEDDAEVAGVLDALGVIQQIKGRYDEAESLHRQSLELNEESENIVGMSVNFGNLAMLSIHREQYDEAAAYATRAYEIDLELEDENGVAHYHNLMGDIEVERGNLEESEQEFLQALKLYRDCGDAEDMASVYSKLGVLYQKRGQLDSAEHYAVEALKLSEEMQHGDGIPSSLDVLAMIRKEQGRIDEARQLWTRALELFRALDSRKMIAEVQDHLAELDA